MGKIYYYKGFKFYKGKNPLYGNYYFIVSKKDGQIAPSDMYAPHSIRECKEVINNWLNS